VAKHHHFAKKEVPSHWSMEFFGKISKKIATL
jgi:hypothetical protein